MARNKAHKARFSSNRAIARRAQGRVAGGPKAGAAAPTKSANSVQIKGGEASGNKHRKRQSTDSIRKNKNEVSRATKAIGFDGPPRICGLVNANESGNSAAVYHALVEACGSSAELGVPVTVQFQPASLRLTLVCEGNDIDEQVALDIAKVSDIVVLSLDCSSAVQDMLRDVRREGEMQEHQQFQQMRSNQSSNGGGDDDDDNDDTMSRNNNNNNNNFDDTRSQATWFSDIGLCITDQTRELVQYINAQGSPSIVVCLQGLDTYTDDRRRRQVVRLHERYFQSVLCSEHRVVVDTQSLMRTLETIKLRKLHFRDIRPYFVADDGDYDESARELHLSGYLRGSNLSAKQLVHITNHGTFQIRMIMAPGDPCPARKSSVACLSGVVDQSTEEERESLVEIQASESVLSENEDGLPSAADVFAAAREREQQEKEEKARLAAHYERVAELKAQAAANGGGDDDDDAHQRRGNVVATEFLLNRESGVVRYTKELRPDMDVSAAAAAMSDRGSEAGGGGGGAGGRAPSNFGMSAASGARSEIEFKRSADILRFERQTDQEREEELRLLREEADDQEHGPDEKDTPYHIPARQRFAKYRGLKSFHNSAWDPNENLPIEFGHIFKFKGFTSVREQAVRVVAEGPAPMGLYVRITLVDVPPTVWENATDLLIVSGLLPHENKWSLLHFRTQKSGEYEEPVKSKTPMLAHIGFRKFFCQPIFSEPVAMGGGRTKYSRYLMPGDSFKNVSFFGPISYYPTPILLFKALSLEEQSEGGVPMPLICYGAALPPDPDFLILKRIVLTGKIGVIYKKQIVIRYMFWNDEDVRYFQPIDLYTKLGRRGKIKKSLGVHGMFKAELNDMTMQHDVICMDLWKRVFPKWKTVPYNVAEIADSTDQKRKELAKEDDVLDD